MVAKALHVHAIEAAEVARIGQPDADLGHIGQRAVGQSQSVLHTLEHLPRLRFNASHDDLALVIGGHLAGHKNEIARAGGGREGTGQAVGSDRGLAKGFYWHGKHSFE